MTDKRIAQQHHATFDSIRQQDEEGNEYWLARPLAKVLDYSEYRHFLPVLERAKEACRNSGQADRRPFRGCPRNGRNRFRRKTRTPRC